MPVWSTGTSPVKASAALLIESQCLKSEGLDKMFEEFTNVKSYLKNRPNIFDDWNEKNTPFVDRWMEIISHFKQNSLTFNVFIKLIEYVVVLPGNYYLLIFNSIFISNFILIFVKCLTFLF